MFFEEEVILADNLTPYSGIYEIRCRANGWIYVGQSRCVQARIISHINSLARDRHSVIEMQRDWNIYGPGAFSAVIVRRVAEDEDILQAEGAQMSRRMVEGAQLYNVVTPEPGVERRAENLRQIRARVLELRRIREENRKSAKKGQTPTPAKMDSQPSRPAYVHSLFILDLPEEIERLTDDDLEVTVFEHEGSPDTGSDDYLDNVMNAFDDLVEEGDPYRMTECLTKYVRPQVVASLVHYLMCPVHAVWFDYKTERTESILERPTEGLDIRVLMGRYCAAILDGELKLETAEHPQEWMRVMGRWYKTHYWHNGENGWAKAR